MGGRLIRCLAFGASCTLLPLIAWAQSSSTGSIAGVVKDTTDAVLPGIAVEASSPVLIEKVRTATTDDQTTPTLSSGQDEKAAGGLFLQRCSLCHIETPPTYDSYGPILDGQRMANLGDERLRKIIVDGSTRMPGWRYALTPAQIESLIAYVKTIKNWPETEGGRKGGPPVGPDFPRVQ